MGVVRDRYSTKPHIRVVFAKSLTNRLHAFHLIANITLTQKLVIYSVLLAQMSGIKHSLGRKKILFPVVESFGYSLFLPRISDNFRGNTVKFFNQILGHILNLFLEKAIAPRGNLFAQPRKDFSFSILEFFPQRCNPGNLNENFCSGQPPRS